MFKLRLSIVGYLNSLPLSWGFIHNQSKDVFDYDFSPPSLCADQIAVGSVDVGLIPAIEYQRITNLKIVPNLSVASKRKVSSVLLISKVPIQKVNSIALDKSSRTSVALLQILLKIRFKLNPLVTSHEPDLKKKSLTFPRKLKFFWFFLYRLYMAHVYTRILMAISCSLSPPTILHTIYLTL